MKALSVLLVLCSVVSSAVLLAQPTQWRDQETGRTYRLLDGETGAWEASHQCAEQGEALLDIRSLTDAERKRFLTSAELKQLRWEEKFAGTSNPARLTQIWQPSEITTMISGAPSSIAVLVMMERGGKLFTNFEWRSPTEFKANAICMSVPGFWFRCSTEYKCVHDAGTSKFSFRYLFVEYGNTENEAYKKIVTRSEDPKWSVSEGKCSLQTESGRCIRMIPSL